MIEAGETCYVDVRGTILKGSLTGEVDHLGAKMFKGVNSPASSFGFPVNAADCFPDLESALEHCKGMAAAYEYEAEKCERLIEAEERQAEEEAADDKMQAGRNAA